MDDEPDWAILLETLYDGERSRFKRNQRSGGPLPDSNVLIDETGLSRDELNEAIQYLRDAGLLKPTGDSGQFKITEEGFQVAHDRRMQQQQQQREDRRVERQQELEDQRVKQQEEREDRRAKRHHQINRAVAFLTLGLMTVTVGDSAARVFVGKNDFFGAFGAVVAGLILVAVFTLVLNYSGLLSAYSSS